MTYTFKCTVLLSVLYFKYIFSSPVILEEDCTFLSSVTWVHYKILMTP